MAVGWGRLGHVLQSATKGDAGDKQAKRSRELIIVMASAKRRPCADESWIGIAKVALKKDAHRCAQHRIVRASGFCLDGPVFASAVYPHST